MIKIEQNKNEITRRLIKYILHTLLIIVLLKYTPCYPIPNKDVISLTLSASILFSLLDIYSPGIIYINK